ncbi:hypothetical protein TcWFU_002786 [Taenia crassiceps]|uniref:Uncharacterized protein n=1 Tax=Taenia crassiceps TaxID=6207 RepID=A0ABR4QQ03_9CEST
MRRILPQGFLPCGHPETMTDSQKPGCIASHRIPQYACLKPEGDNFPAKPLINFCGLKVHLRTCLRKYISAVTSAAILLCPAGTGLCAMSAASIPLLVP